MAGDRADLSRAATSRARSTSSRRSRASCSTACRTTMPLRRSVAGHLTAEQRFRRALEDVLVGAGFSEAYTWSLVALRSRSRRAAAARPDERRAGRAPHDPAPRASSRPRASTSTPATTRSALFELARVYLPSGEPLPDERLARRRASRRAGSAARAVPSRRSTRRSTSRSRPRADDARRTSTRARRPRPTPAGSASSIPTLLEGAWGVFELDVAALMAPLPERILYEDVITYPAVRQDIAVVVGGGRRGGRDRRRCAARPGATSSATPASSTSTTATRSARAGSPSPCTSSSRRPTGRSPTRRRMRPGADRRRARRAGRRGAARLAP